MSSNSARTVQKRMAPESKQWPSTSAHLHSKPIEIHTVRRADTSINAKLPNISAPTQQYDKMSVLARNLEQIYNGSSTYIYLYMVAGALLVWEALQYICFVLWSRKYRWDLAILDDLWSLRPVERVCLWFNGNAYLYALYYLLTQMATLYFLAIKMEVVQQIKNRPWFRYHPEQSHRDISAAGGSGPLNSRLHTLFVKTGPVISLTYYNAEGNQLDSGKDVDDTGPYLLDLPNESEVYYAGTAVTKTWATVLLDSPLPAHLASFKRFLGWLGEVDDLNIRWQVILQEWDLDWWKLPEGADAAVTNVFKNLTRSNTYVGVSLVKAHMAEAATMLARCEHADGHAEYIPETIAYLLPNRWSTPESCTPDFWTRTFHQLDHLNNPVRPNSQRARLFPTSVWTSWILTPRLFSSFTPKIRMSESAVEHKDWKNLLVIMRGGAKEQAVKWKIPSEAVRIFGILFGAET
ncbi:hypothetical protein DFS34DRAFT_659394 [Phlyctochytrium arcticum]|nr:hypothetical protein DFS34DRAFT_659394 [Phlyctochytrium arcticum]